MDRNEFIKRLFERAREKAGGAPDFACEACFGSNESFEVQVKNGEICAVRMADDLTRAIGEPTVLFRAADATGVSEWKPNSGIYVTDGPFLFREGGHIKMIWSSFYHGRYLVLEAESDRLFGEWRHLGSRFDFDGGHAMVFTRLDGERMIALHRPNTANDERATFMTY